MPLKLGTRRNLHSFKSKMTLGVGIKVLAEKPHYVSVSFVKNEAWCGIPHFHYIRDQVEVKGVDLVCCQA